MDTDAYPEDAPTGLTPTQRMAAILRYLSFRYPASVASANLRAITKDYAGDEGDRTLRRDLKELRDRGLVETGLSDHPHLSGVRLAVPTKHRRLHLTRREHAALARARQRLRPGPAVVEVRSGRGRHLDVALAVIRYLEEGDGEARGSALARHLGISVDALYAVLGAFVFNPAADPSNQMKDEPALEDLDIEDEDIDEDDTLRDFLVLLRRPQPHRDRPLDGEDERERRLAHVRSAEGLSPSPTAGHGLDHFGRFAYTLAETDERLELISKALFDDGTPEGDITWLQAAEMKLMEWRSLLDSVSAVR
ncbi:hypothetical protein ACI79C_03150 [Geodermatophilus sp. SYSU D00697]